MAFNGNQRRYKVVKPIKFPEGEISIGTQLDIMYNRLYVNGGMVSPAYYGVLMDIIDNESENGYNYLREVIIPLNKA
jgi:hypothetical protein